MEFRERMDITITLISYLDSEKRTLEGQCISEWIVNELLGIANNYSGSGTIFVIIDKFRSDIDYLVYKNLNDPRNSLFEKALLELNKIEIYALMKEKKYVIQDYLG